MPPTAVETDILVSETRDAERVSPFDTRAGLISVNAARHSGTPCFAGTRVPVHDLFDYLAGGESLESFLESFPTVSEEQAVRLLRLAEEKALAGLLGS